MGDHSDIDHTGLTGVGGSPQPLDTTDSPQFAGVNIGHASDTTLTRASAGIVAVEGTNLVKAGAATGSGLTMATAKLLGRTTASTGAIEEISVGSGLTLSGGSLSASGSSGASELPIDAAATAAVGSGDLFGGTSLDGGWSDMNTAVSSKDRSVDGYLILKNSGSTSGQERGIKRSFSPAGDFTVYTKINYATTAEAFQWVGMFVGATDPSDAASGQSRLTNFLIYNSGLKLKSEKWSSGSASTVYDEFLDSLTTQEGIIRTGAQFPIWLRIKRVGSTLTMGFSFDGVQFIDHATTTTITMTINTIGLYIAENSATKNIRAVFKYIATTG